MRPTLGQGLTTLSTPQGTLPQALLSVGLNPRQAPVQAQLRVVQATCLLLEAAVGQMPTLVVGLLVLDLVLPRRRT